MIRISVSNFEPKSPRLTGSVIGDEHARQLEQILSNAPAASDVFVLDFAGIESASASYLKRLLNPFFDTDGQIDSVRRFSPVIVNAREQDLVEDLEDYLAGKSRVLVVADELPEGLHFAHILGRLDGAAAETFEELRQRKEVTAQQLYELHGKRTTNQTAWNNRLAQLVELRIARRRREGRFWIYQPTVTT